MDSDVGKRSLLKQLHCWFLLIIQACLSLWCTEFKKAHNGNSRKHTNFRMASSMTMRKFWNGMEASSLNHWHCLSTAIAWWGPHNESWSGKKFKVADACCCCFEWLPIGWCPGRASNLQLKLKTHDKMQMRLKHAQWSQPIDMHVGTTDCDGLTCYANSQFQFGQFVKCNFSNLVAATPGAMVNAPLQFIMLHHNEKAANS